MTVTADDLALMRDYRELKFEYEKLVYVFAPEHVPGQPWPRCVRAAEARMNRLKADQGGAVPGDPECCQRYGRLHLPEFALTGCRWHDLPELHELLPVPADAVRCGNRADLPKARRRHLFAELGTDVRHAGEHGEQRETRVRVCVRCGIDKQGG